MYYVTCNNQDKFLNIKKCKKIIKINIRKVVVQVPVKGILEQTEPQKKHCVGTVSEYCLKIVYKKSLFLIESKGLHQGKLIIMLGKEFYQKIAPQTTQ